MNEDIINLVIKILFINILNFVVNFKMIHRKFNIRNFVVIIAASVLLTVIYTIMSKYIDNLLNIIIMYIGQTAVLKLVEKTDKNEVLMIKNLMANAIVYIFFGISAVIELPLMVMCGIKHISILNFTIIGIIECCLIQLFFVIKRFNKGFSFFIDKIDTGYSSAIMLNISAMVILAYYLYGNYYGNLTKQLLICFIVLGILMIITIKKTLTLYYKQKLLAKNIEDYKSEIALKDAQIKSLSDEKYKISKLNHEFYNRQRALIHKVEEITSMNTEIADELDLSKQINDLTKEYTDKAQEIKTLDKLPTTGIVEIDDMFKYMQSECDSKKIQFNLKINGNIYHMINNKIPQSRLVTLIGDHLRDAIIAIDFSNNTFKSILAVLGENNGVYEFCVFDTGIEFKIDTLLNLGLKPATTHKDSGGTGIGFMTTFETMKETKASLIIDEMREMSNTDYTKSVTIRFDGKNEYRIKSYRSDEIKKKMKDNRIIIENKKGSSTQWN